MTRHSSSLLLALTLGLGSCQCGSAGELAQEGEFCEEHRDCDDELLCSHGLCSRAFLDAGGIDARATDRVATDRAATDRAATDLAGADLAVVDAAQPDRRSTDLLMPDLRAADSATTIVDGGLIDAVHPDHQGPDLTAPDATAPDLSAPDLLQPDTSAPDTLSPDTSVSVAPCGPYDLAVGYYATWCGKVNVHTSQTTGGWEVDSDCSSGCENDTVAYCQKFWSHVTSQVEVTPTSAPKPFANAGCPAELPHTGDNQYACCAPYLSDPCGDSAEPVGEYATWCGKVNVHRDWGDYWRVDSDCASGCENDTVGYCQKFWPSATSQVSVTPSAEQKPFYTGGCADQELATGSQQFVCCAPNP